MGLASITRKLGDECTQLNIESLQPEQLNPGLCGVKNAALKGPHSPDSRKHSENGVWPKCAACAREGERVFVQGMAPSPWAITAARSFELWRAQVDLERAMGVTTVHNRCFDVTEAHGGLVAFAAGCVVVLYSPRKNTQEFLKASGPVSCLHFSHDGEYIAAGHVSTGCALAGSCPRH
jgi:hypothetical protein